jgi:hypothetical protein
MKKKIPLEKVVFFYVINNIDDLNPGGILDD